MSKKKILITGAGGRFCQILVPDLIEAGHSVVATDVAQLNYQCKCLTISVTDFPRLLTALWDVDVVLHAAGLHQQLPRTPTRPDAYDIFYQVNVTGTHNVLMAAQQAGVRKVIFISSIAYYAGGEGYIDEHWPAARPPDQYYSLSKVMAEDLCRYLHLSQMATTCWRATTPVSRTPTPKRLTVLCFMMTSARRNG